MVIIHLARVTWHFSIQLLIKMKFTISGFGSQRKGISFYGRCPCAICGLMSNAKSSAGCTTTLVPFGDGCLAKKMYNGVWLAHLAWNILLNIRFDIIATKKIWQCAHSPMKWDDFWFWTLFYILCFYNLFSSRRGVLIWKLEKCKFSNWLIRHISACFLSKMLTQWET